MKISNKKLNTKDKDIKPKNFLQSLQEAKENNEARLLEVLKKYKMVTITTHLKKDEIIELGVRNGIILSSKLNKQDMVELIITHLEELTQSNKTSTPTTPIKPTKTKKTKKTTK